ncbi:hypothetical protein F3Y22_tig00110893pilonHSYRG01109 [Hibiscus syriacus]|uniref:RING-type E3 ubiquitin transferase n=1 Tax=Hibiscus syriacus TaxID=106335 RepID=A0A6A2ZGI0_HIBSY|nr:hypothetical protein F3Y22_tig00110893pilonHSYRG01109 [Hibiscus syriacus]
MHRFLEVTARLEEVELVPAQFRRSKGRVDAPVVELYEDLLSSYNKSDAILDPDVLRRMAKKLQLVGSAELTQESLALHEMVSASGGDPGQTFEKMSNLLKEIKDFIQTENPSLDAPSREKNLPPSSSGQATTDENHKTPVIPDDFRCPISLELVKDPVIVSTGQLNGVRQMVLNHPKDLVVLDPVKLYLPARLLNVLRLKFSFTSLHPAILKTREWLHVKSDFLPNAMQIIVWPLPKLGPFLSFIISSGAVPGIVQVLKKGSMEARENAAATLFSLSVVDEIKVTIGASGAIPPLVTLLSEGTQRGKKDAATAVFNLCIYQGNKGKAVRDGVVPTLMRVLKEPEGGMVDEALAILAMLASHPEGKSSIGAAEAVPVW